MATTREEKRNLLNRLAGELGQAEDVERASLFTAEELEAPMDVVRCLITETGADLLDLLVVFLFPRRRRFGDGVHLFHHPRVGQFPFEFHVHCRYLFIFRSTEPQLR